MRSPRLGPLEAHTKRHEIGAHGWFCVRLDPPCGAVATAMSFGIGGGKNRLSSAAQPMDHGDRDPALVALERFLNRRERFVAAEKMLWNPDRDVGDREHLAGKARLVWRLAPRHELAEAQARRTIGDAEKLATEKMVAERWQLAGFYNHEQNKAWPVAGCLPQCRMAFERRIRRLQIFVRDDAEHIVGGIEALFHPGVNVFAALDLPLMNVRRARSRTSPAAGGS